MTAHPAGRTAARDAGRAAAAFQEAVRLHQQGRPFQAEALCAQALQADPRHPGAWHLRGMLALQGGDVEQGVAWIERSLELHPEQPAAHSNIGNALLGKGQAQHALESFNRALRLKPDYPVALFNRGNACRALGQPARALEDYDAVLRLNARHVPALNNRALALLDLDRTEEAVTALRQAVEIDAGYREARRNLAAALLRAGRPGDALDVCGHILALDGADAQAWLAQANALVRLNRRAEALEAFSRALALRPSFVDCLINRGNLLQDLQRPADALADFERALALAPDSALAWGNAGNALLALGRAEAALERQEQALRRAPGSADILYNRGAALRELGRLAEAAEAYAAVLAIAPAHEQAAGNLFHVRLDACDWRDYAGLMARLRADLERRQWVVNPLSGLLLDAPELQLACAQGYVAGRFPSAERISPRARGRLRVAYVSGDFREHPVAWLLAGVLEQHDRAGFEVIGVCLREPEDSALGRRMRAACDEVIDAAGLSDEAVAARLRERGIDIAVDLMGFTQGMRLGIFAHRAAPVQVGYLGYAGTTGADFMDCLIADAVVIPPGQERWYSEAVVRLPHCYLPNDDRREMAAPPTRAQAGLPEQALVLCAFTNAYKLNPPLFDLWMRLLRELPQSVLWLRALPPLARANLLREARSRGVDERRLIFAPHAPDMAQHLARLSLADLYLDTLPYNAHSTALDALWSGVPVITCPGAGFASRVAASALTAAGLPQLITRDFDDYARAVLELARDPVRLQQLRQHLALERTGLPLFDTTAYTRQLEAAYRGLQERALQGAPLAFDVARAQAVGREPPGTQPGHADAWHLRGLRALQAGRHEEAAECIGRSLDLSPHQPAAHANLGTALLGAGRGQEALWHLDRALALEPGNGVTLYSRASALTGCGRHAEALADVERALALLPQLVPAHLLRGRALLELSRPREALVSFDQALALSSADGLALLGRGLALRQLARLDEALESFEQALLADPRSVEAQINRGDVLLDLLRTGEALQCYEAALRIEPDSADALDSQALALTMANRPLEAVRAYARLLAVAPEYRNARGNLLYARAMCCDWTDREAAREALLSGSGAPAIHPFALLSVTDSAAQQLRCARGLAQSTWPAAAAVGAPRAVRRAGPLRVAYVSADLRSHAVMFLLAGVLERHDRAAFETFGIALRPPEDSLMGRRAVAAFGRFIDASTLGEEQIAGLLRELDIDIAVDLTGYTRWSRPGIFARHAAPVQVGWLGYPGTLGARFMDYLIADEFVVPSELEPHYAERIVRLPCFQPNDEQRVLPGPASRA
ncbi:MAG TPA: tetratricopeptide repeat protein, partial [Steroidobacteraceae bacterium]|nr:tetratricopeptide repeat protein [Steroidobacteraceae bacterium]